MYNIIDLSNYIIQYCQKNKYSISNLKLQKLLYFIQAQFLVQYDKPIFNNAIEAWDFGPVVPEAFDYFKMFGSSEIKLPKLIAKKATQKITMHDQKIIDAVLNQCAYHSPSYLTRLTIHQTPWLNNYKKPYDKTIPNEEIRNFFS